MSHNMPEIARILHQGQPRWALLHADSAYLEVIGFTGYGAEGAFEKAFTSKLSKYTEILPRKDLEYLAPLTAERRVFCVGRNYADHASEMGGEVPAYPNLFFRQAQSLVGHSTPLKKPKVSEQYDYEGELAVVIGRQGTMIAESNALVHVAGYTLLMDGSVRDFQKHSLLIGKNFDGSGACGPSIVSASQIPDPQNLAIETRINGEMMQHSNTAKMIFPVAELIAYISTVTELKPGDIISTGTPEGVGFGREPQRWLKPDDKLIVSVESVGDLVNIVSQ